MNEGLTLRMLEQVMGWDETVLRYEFTWLRLMARFKYDSYRDYLGGMRFLECLVDWLQQFAPEHRQTAYDYVRQNLIFISRSEMEHLVEQFFSEHIDPALTSELSRRLQIPRYTLWQHGGAEAEYAHELKKTLFLGLSDGARMDVFRRANEGRVSNEQVVATIQMGELKWTEVLVKLVKATKLKDSKFHRIYLIDDFIGSGKTLLRFDEKEQLWDGKLKRFYDENKERFSACMTDDWTLYVHHYVCSHEAAERVESTEKQARAVFGTDWFKNVKFSFSLILPKPAKLTQQSDPKFWEITEQYYNSAIESDSIRVGGDTAKRGFGNCGLPLILEHNTPNNSVALLWADSSGMPGTEMRPLFRRAQRHW